MWSHIRRFEGVALPILVVAAMLLGCGGKEECRVEVTYEGRVHPGAGKTFEDARRGSCWKYCIDHDDSVERAWKRWKKKGGKSKDKSFDLTAEPDLKKMLDGCTDNCEAKVKKRKGGVKKLSGCD